MTPLPAPAPPASAGPGIRAGGGGPLRGVPRILSIAAHYMGQTVKVKLAYRAELAVSLVSSLLWSAVNLVFFAVIFGEVPSMKGWSFEQVVFLYGFGQYAFGIFSVFAFSLMWQFGSEYLVEGQLDRVLLRPYPPLLQMVLDQLSVFDAIIVVKGVAIAGWAAWRLGIPFSLGSAVAFLALGVAAAAVLTGIALSLTFVSFWWPNRYGLFRPLFTLTEYSRYPIRIFPRWVQVLLTFVLPFGFACFYPAAWFFDDASLRRIAWLTPAVGAACMALASTLLRRGIDRYESAGS